MKIELKGLTVTKREKKEIETDKGMKEGYAITLQKEDTAVLIKTPHPHEELDIELKVNVIISSEQTTLSKVEELKKDMEEEEPQEEVEEE